MSFLNISIKNEKKNRNKYCYLLCIGLCIFRYTDVSEMNLLTVVTDKLFRLIDALKQNFIATFV